MSRKTRQYHGTVRPMVPIPAESPAVQYQQPEQAVIGPILSAALGGAGLTPLTSAQLGMINAMVDYRGHSVFVPGKLDEVYEFVGLAKVIGVNEALNWYVSNAPNTESSIERVLIYPTNSSSKDRYEVDAEILRKKIPSLRSGKKCVRHTCGSTNTVSSYMQIRSADEGMTEINSCLVCGQSWKGD